MSTKFKGGWPCIATLGQGHCGKCVGCEANDLLRQRDELLAACKEFAVWFDGWCPQNKCCASSGLTIHEKVVKLIAKAGATP